MVERLSANEGDTVAIPRRVLVSALLKHSVRHFPPGGHSLYPGFCDSAVCLPVLEAQLSVHPRFAKES